MSEGHIWIDGVISEEMYEHVKQELAFNRNADTIILHIASPGGSVRQGNKIFHLLNNSGKTIKPLVEGEASSMASYLALMGPSRICNPSKFMIHLPQNEIAGTAEDLIKGANELITIENEMAQAYSKKTGLPIERIKQMMKVETVMDAKQAKDLGFIDEVIGSFSEAVALGQTIRKSDFKKGINTQQPQVMTDKKQKLLQIINLASEALLSND